MIDRALIAGLGSIGRRHLRLLRAALPQADIRVLRHAHCDDTIEFADGCFDRLEEACDFAPQLAIIASPASFHIPTAKALAQSGAHLLVEKPISDSVEGVADLVGFCKAEGRALHVGYNLRFLHTLQQFRSVLADGRIGQVYGVRCEIGQYLPGWRNGADYRTTVSARRDLGGGVLLELSHELDMLRWVFGEVSWLSAWSGRQSALEIDVDDTAMIQMGFANGPVAQLGMDFLRRDTKRMCTAIGEKGSLTWDAVAGRTMLFDPENGSWIDLRSESPDRDFTYSAQIAALIGAIEANTPGDIAAQGRDGLAVMQLVEAARLSHEQIGRRIAVGSPA